MEPKTLVLQYLDEAHALEEALVTNLKAHSAMTPSGTYKTLLDRHAKTTQGHADAIERRRRELCEELNVDAENGKGVVQSGMSLVRDAVGQAIVLTKGPIDAIRGTGVNEKLLKNAKDECTTEAQEIATYDALEAAAKAAGDDKTAKLAASHRADEEEMLEALRSEIPRLAIGDIEERSGAKVDKSAATTTSRTSSGRTTSSRSSSSKGSATKKAGAAKSSTSGRRSASKSSSGTASTKSSSGTSRTSSSRSTGGKSKASGSTSRTGSSSGSKS